LKNVSHIPNICLNLISIQELDEDGYHNSFGDGKWKCTKGKIVVEKAKKQNILLDINKVIYTSSECN